MRYARKMLSICYFCCGLSYINGYKSCIVNFCYCLLWKRLELCFSASFNLCSAVYIMCCHCIAIACCPFSVFCIGCYCVVCCYLFVAERCAAVMHSCHGHHLQRAVIVHVSLANVVICVFRASQISIIISLSSPALVISYCDTGMIFFCRASHFSCRI